MLTLAKDGGVSASIWTDADQERHDTPPPHEIDACIVGGGIAGLTTALMLSRQGVRVAVLDDGPLGGGETGRTSAHLTSAVDDRYYELEARFGERAAQLVAESHAAAIDWIEATVLELGIDCDFRRVDGYLVAPPDQPGERAQRELDRELVAAQRAGLIVERVDRAPLPFDRGPALRFARQAELHPLRYLRGLAAAVIEAGGTIHTGVHVEAIVPARPLAVRLSGGRTLLCRFAVDATNSSITSPRTLPLRQAAYRSYCLAIPVAPGTIPHALYWDTAHPYHYIRVAPGDSPDRSGRQAGPFGSATRGRELVIVGGADHRTGQGDPFEAWAALERWTRRWLRLDGPVVARWSGQIIEPVDGPAHIGKSPDLEHVYVVTGDSGDGLTHGTIAGLLIPELVRGHNPPWADVYAPDRSHLHSLGTLVKEAAHQAAPYVGWLRAGEVHSLDEIPQGQGALLRRGLHLIAAYRDPSGACHLRSATCPHLRGVVHWNPGEQTWDCPCHGSRFDPYGRVVNGPATVDLTVIEEPPRLEAPVREPEPERPERPIQSPLLAPFFPGDH
jgi:glycine/D-amino acid oxidase-like deaminating enzyme/nitrite reductase/ring-hydroxylating ferredoxin subunit